MSEYSSTVSSGVGIFDDCPKCNHPLAFHPAGPQGEDGKQCGCRLTRVQLKEAGVGIFDDCQGCGHKFGHHPAGPQGEGRSSCHLIQHRCCDLKLSLAHLISSHLTISFASFCKIAQAGGGGQGQGELWCHGVVLFLAIALTTLFLCVVLASPKLMNSVFILIDANLSPAGTAFVISPTCVISAYHCVADDAKKPTKKHTNQWRIANGLERKSDGNVSNSIGS